MANVWAIKSGDWSDTTVWNTGALPTINDVVRPNGFTVNIDKNISVQSLLNNASGSILADGKFTLTGNYTVEVSINIQGFASAVLIYNGTGTATVKGSNTSATLNSTSVDDVASLVHSSTGRLIVDMIVKNTSVSASGRKYNILVSGGGTLDVLKLIVREYISNASFNIAVTTVSDAILNLYGIDAQQKGGNINGINRGVAIFVKCTVNVSNTLKSRNDGTTSGGSLIDITSGAIGSKINVNCTIVGGSSSCISVNAAGCNITVIGDVISQNGGGNGNAIYCSDNSVVNVIGNVIGATSVSSNGTTIIMLAGTLIINGNISSTGNCRGVLISSTANLNLTGNVIGGSIPSLYSDSVGTVNITGSITGGLLNGSFGAQFANGTVNHIGLCQASAFGSAIYSTKPASVFLTGPFLKNGDVVANACQTFRINFGSNSYFQFRKSNGENIDYVSTIEGYNYPTPADVRYGVEYKSGLVIGTCHVPTPDNVRKNIPVDNTVGTSDNVNAEDILEAIQNSSLPIAERLRNVATVESTGAQLEAYQ